MLCWFLPYSNINQPQVYMCPLLLETPSHSISPLWVVREHQGEFPALYISFPLATLGEIVSLCSLFRTPKSNLDGCFKPLVQNLSKIFDYDPHFKSTFYLVIQCTHTHTFL